MRLFLLLFWVCIGVVFASIGQNFFMNVSILSNDVFILIGIIVVLVFCDEITKSLNSKERITKQVEDELTRDYEQKYDAQLSELKRLKETVLNQ